jgi:crotonobetainyl-CoA:carnitine CoA-transferase CaiB-like acyl-CoA transferase
MERPELGEDPRYRTLSDRQQHAVEIDSLIATWTSKREAAELAAQLQKQGLPAAKSVNSIELVADPHLWDEGFFPIVSDRAGRTRPVVGSSWTMTRGAEIRDAGPRLGEHNDYVLDEILGLSDEQRRRLDAAGALR